MGAFRRGGAAGRPGWGGAHSTLDVALTLADVGNRLP
jgi:hypothetical protein